MLVPILLWLIAEAGHCKAAGGNVRVYKLLRLGRDSLRSHRLLEAGQCLLRIIHEHVGPLDILLLLLVVPLSVLPVLLQSCLSDTALSGALAPSICRLR